MIYIVKINDKMYEVEVEKGSATIVNTTDTAPATSPVAPATVAPATVTPATVPAAPAAPAGTAHGTVIAAPMPGTILDIKVAPGAQVKKGAILLVLEAMKMENEILAPADGTVSAVSVSKGASVSTGDALITIQ
ncbi:MAG: biotin/lipoyl-containing protein [Eubacteriales bacterium]